MADQLNHTAVASQTLFNVKGLVALVTKGGSGMGHSPTSSPSTYVLIHIGLGLMVAKGVARNGAAKAYIAGRRLEFLQEAAAAIGPQVATPTPQTTLEDWAAQNVSHDVQSYIDTCTINVTAVWYTAMACLTLLDADNRKGNLQ